MRLGGTAWAVIGPSVLACLACGSAPPPPPATPEPEEHEAAPEPAQAATTTVDTPERTRPPSTASYEEATSTPESLDIHDEHAHLTDGQLTGPMRGVLTGCRVPPNAKITIRTAVQNGRAVGVSVDVRFTRPKNARPPSRATIKAESKAAAKVSACVDRNVRAIVWPPSRRRDSFTTEF